MSYVYLAIAIISEVVATTALKATNGFTKIIPSAIVIIGYGTAFYFLSLVLKTMPVGIVYAVWSGLGIVLVTIMDAIYFKQIPDIPAIIGMFLIISGVLVLNLFSKTVVH